MKKSNIVCLVLYLIVLVGLTSCSQGGGGAATNSDVTPPSVPDGISSTSDVTPPNVPDGISSTPTSSSSIGLNWNVSTDDVGVAGYKIFRNGVQISTLTANAFSDTGLLSSTTYTYTISAYDGTGNESAQSAAVSATTLPPGSTAVQTSQIATDVGLSPAYPQIAAGASGHSFAIWRQSAGAVDIVVSAQSHSTDGWGPVTELMPTNIGSALSHDIATNSSGDAMAVWELDDGLSYHIWANKYVSGTGWAGAVSIDSSGVLDAKEPAVAVDVNGNAMAVWRQTDGTTYKIWANHFVAGTGWGTSGLIDIDTGGFDYSPQIAFDSGGNAIAVWLRRDGSAYSIRARRYVNGTGWDSVIAILSVKLGYSQDPRIAMDSAGNAFVVWNQVDVYPVISAWSCRYVSGTGWETAVVIETDDSGYTYNARIAVTPSGDAFAAWEQSDGTRYNIVANQYVAGIGWGSAQTISSPGGDGTQWPALALNGAGNAVVAWEQFSYGSNSHKIYAAKYFAGEGWSNEQPIQADADTVAVYPEITVDQDGYASVIWEQHQNNKVGIWGARFR